MLQSAPLNTHRYWLWRQSGGADANTYTHTQFPNGPCILNATLWRRNLKLLEQSVKTGCYTLARLTTHLFWLVLWSFLLPCLTAATLPFTTMNQTTHSCWFKWLLEDIEKTTPKTSGLSLHRYANTNLEVTVCLWDLFVCLFFTKADYLFSIDLIRWKNSCALTKRKFKVFECLKHVKQCWSVNCCLRAIWSCGLFWLLFWFVNMPQIHPTLQIHYARFRFLL